MNSRITRLLPALLILTCGHALAQKQDSGQDKARLLRGTLLSPKAFRVAASRIEPALVKIDSFGGISTVAGRIGGIRKQGEGNTTGVMISPDGYFISSSFNFINQPPVITVVTSDGKRRVADLLGRDDTRRICLLKIRSTKDNPVKDMPVPEMVDPKDIKVGQYAISVGFGYGDDSSAVSQGIISALNRAGGRAIQTDANISPANYGGALVDIRGRLLGICVPLNPRAPSAAAGVEWYDSGIGFAIPIHGLEKVIEQLKDKDTVISPAYLGVQGQFSVVNVGVKIKKAMGPAKEAGLKKNDIIVAIGDKIIRDMTDLRFALSRNIAGDKISVTIRRKEEEQKINVKLGKAPSSKKKKLEPFKR